MANGWRGTPITVGLLAFLVVAGTGVAAFTIRGDGHIKEIVKETLKQHCETDIDRAHSDLKSRYVPRGEMKDQLSTMDGRLQRIEWSQKLVLDKIGSRPARRPGR